MRLTLYQYSHMKDDDDIHKLYVFWNNVICLFDRNLKPKIIHV